MDFIIALKFTTDKVYPCFWHPIRTDAEYLLGCLQLTQTVKSFWCSEEFFKWPINKICPLYQELMRGTRKAKYLPESLIKKKTHPIEHSILDWSVWSKQSSMLKYIFIYSCALLVFLHSCAIVNKILKSLFCFLRIKGHKKISEYETTRKQLFWS